MIEINLLTAKAAVLILMLAPIVGAWRPDWFGLRKELADRVISAVAAILICAVAGIALVLMALGVKFLLS